jgi:phosphoribosylanthranilate isomerase
MSTSSTRAAGSRLQRPARATSETRIKVCGITQNSEIAVLGDQNIDFAGIWYGVPGGPSDLPLEQWRRFADAAAATPGLEPVLVTFAKDADVLRAALQPTDVRWVQLHGYQTPGFVKKLKAAVPDVHVIKVMHVRGTECVEAPLIGSYERAGVDMFLFDAVSEDGRVGSTGQTLDRDVVIALADQISKPFLIAGGISEVNRDAYAKVAAHPLFLGIDVDTNARGADHKIDAQRVAAIAQAWKEQHA